MTVYSVRKNKERFPSSSEELPNHLLVFGTEEQAMLVAKILSGDNKELFHTVKTYDAEGTLPGNQ